MSAGERFRRVDRLRSGKDFRRLARDGRRVATESFVVLAAVRPEGIQGLGPRLGLTVSRRVGRAVCRNRLKRWIREWFRRRRMLLPVDTDWVVIARAGARELDYSGIVSQLDAAAERLARRLGGRRGEAR